MEGWGKDYFQGYRPDFVWLAPWVIPQPRCSLHNFLSSVHFLRGYQAMTSTTPAGTHSGREAQPKRSKGVVDKPLGQTGKPWSYYIWQVSQKTGRRVRVTVVVKPQRSNQVPKVARKGVVVVSRLPRQRVVRGQMRPLEKRAIPFTNPYTRTQSISRRFFRYSKNKALLSAQPILFQNAYTHTKTRTGYVLPKWRAIIRAGGNATTALTAGEDVVEAKGAHLSLIFEGRVNGFQPWAWWNSLEGGSGFQNFTSAAPIAHFSSGPDTKAQDQAAKALYSKIYQARHQLQGGVILGEIDKTARLLAGTAKNLKQGVISYLGNAVGIRRGKGSKSSKRKAISNTYLESVFGWQPLLHDARDLGKTLGRLLHESDRVRFSAVGWAAEQSANVVTEIRNGDLFASLNRTDITETTVIYRGLFRSTPYEIGSPPLERMISMSGFDFRSFIPTMWELVPYSFVVDYFSNIGDCLYALSTDTSIVQILWRTQVKESSRTFVVRPDSGKSIAQHKSSGGTDVRSFTSEQADGLMTVKRRDISRAVASVPIMVPKLTGIDLPWKQFANIGALISSKLR